MRRVVVTTSRERPDQDQPEHFPVAVTVMLCPDLIRPEQETERRERDAEHTERAGKGLFEACNPRDRCRAGHEGGCERREDLPFGFPEVAAEDRSDRDERGDGDECRRAEKEDAPKRHAYTFSIAGSFASRPAFSRMKLSVAS
jgi:hypothetical protein